jgi:hypothetical protein
MSGWQGTRFWPGKNSGTAFDNSEDLPRRYRAVKSENGSSPWPRQSEFDTRE